MNQLNTKAIILSRTNFGEADRIITVLTPEQGKLRLMARGVRKIKSKLAGGIELFSVNDLSYIPGRGEIATLISSRMSESFGNIVKDINRVQLGYDLIKLINKVTEDHPDQEYFELLKSLLDGLNKDYPIILLNCWFKAQLLKYAGHTPNLFTDSSGKKLSVENKYNFDPDSMSFSPHSSGRFNATIIKVLRLIFSNYSLKDIARVEDIEPTLEKLLPLITIMLRDHLNS